MGLYLTTTPGSRIGDTYDYWVTARAVAMKAELAPGSDTITIDEIGIYAGLLGDAGTEKFKAAIFTHNSGSNMPDSMVANSDSGDITITETTWTKKNYLYTGTKPILTAGVQYWIALLIPAYTSKVIYFDMKSSGAPTSLDISATSWPTDWTGHADRGYGYAIYVVYSTVASGLSILLAANGLGGNMLGGNLNLMG